MKITGRIFALAAVLWMALIFFFSAQTVSESTNFSYSIIGWILNILEPGQHTVSTEKTSGNSLSEEITVFENIPEPPSDTAVKPADIPDIPDDITMKPVEPVNPDASAAPEQDTLQNEAPLPVLPPTTSAGKTEKAENENNTDISVSDTEKVSEEEIIKPMPVPKKEWFGVSPGSFTGFVRNSAHFFLFSILGILVSVAALCEFDKKLKFAILLSGTVCTLYSAFDEIHQLFVDGRTAQIDDFIIDCVGSLCGIIITVIILATARFIRKKKSDKTDKASI